ncbi:17893_t:CDS:2, partial [Racocetra persica]
VNIGVFSQNCGINQPPKPNTIVGYYPAYKYNLKANDFNISSSITHLNYIAFGPNDLTNGTGPYTVFRNQTNINKFGELLKYKGNNSNLNYKLILSVLLPVNDDLTKLPPFSNVPIGLYDPNNQNTRNFTDDLVKIANEYQFDGIDIDYPNKASCFQAKPFNSDFLNQVFKSFLNDISSKLKQPNSSKILTVTGGSNPIILDPTVINFVNIQAYRLNINSNVNGNPTRTSAGIDAVQSLIDSWNFSNRSQLILGIEFGGIIEAITLRNPSNPNPNMDIAIQNFDVVRSQNITFPPVTIDENITDPCANTSFAHLSWKTLSNFLAPPCYTNTSNDWYYGFDNKSKQPYIYQQQPRPRPNKGSPSANQQPT